MTDTPQEHLLGRDDALDQISALLLGVYHPWITLVGPPGVGKTSLARALIHHTRLASARFVDLTTADDLGDALSLTAQALAVPTQDSDPARRLALALAALPAPCLLVLDNCEQLLTNERAQLRALWEGWLAQVPHLRLLLTSREAVGSPQERPCQVAPLSLCGDGGPLASPAGQLFLRAARKARPGYEAPPQERWETVAQILTRLDGVPLAIELAAARLALMGEEALEERLHAQLQILRRAGEGHHAAMVTALEWSWRLLEPTDQLILAQCGVFAAPFEVDAAEATLSTGALGGDPLHALERLVARHLVLRVVDGRQVYFRLLYAIAEFAQARLASPDWAPPAALPALQGAPARHRRHYAALAAALLHRAENGHRADATAALLAIAPELRRVVLGATDPEEAACAALALDCALYEQEPPARLHDLLNRAAALAPPWEAQTHTQRGLWLRLQAALGRLAVFLEQPWAPTYEAALALPLDPAPEASLGRAWVLCELAERLFSNDPARASALALELLTLTEHRWDARLLRARALNVLGVCAQILGDLAEAEQRYAQAEQVALALDDAQLEAEILFVRGSLDRQRGRLDLAHARALRAHQRALTGPYHRLQGKTRFALGVLAMDMGQLDEAAQTFSEIIQHHERLGQRQATDDPLARLGLVRLSQGRADLAQPLFARAAGIAREEGALARLVLHLQGEAEALRAQRRWLDAEARLRDALALVRREQHRPPLLLSLAVACAAAGRHDEALALAHQAEPLRDALRTAAERRAFDAERAAIDALLGRMGLALELAARLRGDEGPDFLRVAATRLRLRALHDLLTPAQREDFWAATAPLDRLALWRDGHALKPPGQHDWVDLTRRKLLMDLLASLTASVHGDPVPVEALQEAGWPGQRVLAEAALNRLYKALSELRKAGLGDTLQRVDDAYLLSASPPPLLLPPF